MRPTEPARALCVSLHDVAPQTWPQCQRLLDAIHAVAPIPVSLLVVPEYHRHAVGDAEYEKCLERRLACGDELVLHGYTHLDEAAAPETWRDRFTRQVYTRSEGEFYAIDEAEARRRIELGLAWFARRGWSVQGFVAPAWLLGPGAWKVLADFPFAYTTTMRRFYFLPERQSLASRSLVYTVRSRWRRRMSRAWNSMLCRALSEAPLVRLSLHPTDAAHPDIVRHCQMLIETLTAQRMAMTKASFAATWQGRVAGVSFDAGRLETD
jgi:predicted deacetylase